jgi:hypothetical protein
MKTTSPSQTSSVTVLHYSSNKGNKQVQPGILPEVLPQLVLLVPLQNNSSNEGVILRILLVPVVQQNQAVGIVTMKKYNVV